MSLKRIYFDKALDHEVVVHTTTVHSAKVQVVKRDQDEIVKYGQKYTVARCYLDDPNHFSLIGMSEDDRGGPTQTDVSQEYLKLRTNFRKLKILVGDMMMEHSGLWLPILALGVALATVFVYVSITQ